MFCLCGGTGSHWTGGGNLVGVGSILLPCGHQGLNSGHQAQHQGPLFIEPSQKLKIFRFC